MNKTGWALAIVTFLILIAAVILFALPGHSKAPTVDNQAAITPAAIAHISNLIVVDSIPDGSKISSPLTITGKARGSWYFEASFPVTLDDVRSEIIAKGTAQAQSDWMTEDFVPFSITLTFPPQPAGSIGTLVLMKDNPSGAPQNDETLFIPITF